MTSRDGFTIVWDWNGTLCDDRTILLDAVGQTLVNEGFEPLSQQQLIQRFARPLRTFFENACGRDLLTSEWERVQSTFRRIYRSREAEVTLVEDAYDVLAQGNRSAAGQFLLSLAPHDELMHFVQNTGLPSGSTESVAGLGPTKKTHDAGRTDHAALSESHSRGAHRRFA